MAYEPVKQETKDFYSKVWTHHAVGRFTKPQLAQLFNCDDETVLNAIKWGAKNRASLNTEILSESAMELLEAKIREYGNDIVRLKGSTAVNWNAVIGLERLAMDACEKLWKLQGIINDKSMVTVNNVIANNQLAKVRDELAEGLSDEERKQLASRLREACRITKSDDAAGRSDSVATGAPRV